MDLAAAPVAPGLVDGHIQRIGGGGAAGYESRLPELWLSDLTLRGIKTVVGPPDIDAVSKPMETMLAKASWPDEEALRERVRGELERSPGMRDLICHT